MKIRWILAVCAAGCGAQATTTTTEPADEVVAPVSVEVGPEGSAPQNGRLPQDVSPRRYGLDLTIDPSANGFEGEVAIRARLESPRRVIWLHGHRLDVSSARVSVFPATRGGEAEVFDAEWSGQQDDDSFASLTLPRAVQGEVEIRIRYRAAFEGGLEGIYKVEHAGDAYVFTQMEPLSARRAFPCFDEPSFKTPFDITLRIDPEHVGAANTAVREEREEDGRKVLRFESTEPIPTYLFALAVGPLDVVEAEPIAANEHRLRPLPFRGLAPRGRGAELAYAMEHTPALLVALEGYFGMSYPYDKLDIVAVPDFAAGAMENVGLVTFRDSILLFEEARASTGKLRFWSYITAHELAHQWFGNLVTMEWWDDLWLNEAFASWIEYRAVEDWRPAYEPELELTEWVHRVMGDDSLAAARAIAQPIVSSHDIHNAFDGITYGKGAGVIAMFERWMGREVFQRSVRQYLLQNRFGNATREALLRSMSESAGRDVTTPFNTFLNQPGLPIVQTAVSCGDESSITLRQARYLPAGSTADASTRWQIPVCARYGVGRGARAEVKTICGLMEEESLTLAAEGCPRWVHPNADSAGYYRWMLEPEALVALTREGLPKLSVAERLGLVDSLQAAFGAGTADGGAVLEALLSLASDEHHKVAAASLEFFDHVMVNIVDRAHAEKLRRRLARAYQRDYRRLGWREGAGDDEATKLRRGSVVPFYASVVEDRAARREGARLGQAYVGEDEVNPDAVSSDLVEIAVRLAVQDGDEAFFDRVASRLQSEADGTVRRYLLRGLGSAKDPELAARALELALSPDLRVNELYQPMIMQVRIPENRAATWQWVQEHFDQLTERLPPPFAAYLPQLMSGTCDNQTADEVQGFFSDRIDDLPGGPRNLASAVEAIRLCAAQAEAQRDKVHAWLDR